MLYLFIFCLSYKKNKNFDLTSKSHFKVPIVNYDSVSAQFNLWNKKLKMPLLEHQLLTLQQVVDDDCGKLIAHSLGMGKTVTALAICEWYSTKKIVILIPEIIRFQWEDHLNYFGVENKKRYTILSYETIKEEDLNKIKDSVFIVDEAHNLIELSQNYDFFAKLYMRSRDEASKIFALTGTPMFKSYRDFLYLLELVAQKTLFNNQQDLITSVTIPSSTTNNFFNKMKKRKMDIFSLITSIVFMYLLKNNSFEKNDYELTGVFFISCLLHKMSQLVQLSQNRMFVKNKIEKYKKYFSYVNSEEKQINHFPKVNIKYKDLKIDNNAFKMFIQTVTEQLSEEEKIIFLQEVIEDENQIKTKLSLKMFQEILRVNCLGRMINNLLFVDGDKIIYPNKFYQILKKIQKSKGPVSVYSNFYKSGTLLFADFLEANGENYDILDYNLTSEKIREKIKKYNNGKIKILLIAPKFTEGLSILGTEQLHFLEPTINSTNFFQSIGRHVRYDSHSRLPLKKRVVNVYVWISKYNFFQHFAATSKLQQIAFEYYEKNIPIETIMFWNRMKDDGDCKDLMVSLGENIQSLKEAMK